jgi:hypothetical protein
VGSSSRRKPFPTVHDVLSRHSLCSESYYRFILKRLQSISALNCFAPRFTVRRSVNFGINVHEYAGHHLGLAKISRISQKVRGSFPTPRDPDGCDESDIPQRAVLRDGDSGSGRHSRGLGEQHFREE